MKLFSRLEALVALLVIGVYYIIFTNQSGGMSQDRLPDTQHLSQAMTNSSCDYRASMINHLYIR
jgi:hypothetical protein